MSNFLDFDPSILEHKHLLLKDIEEATKRGAVENGLDPDSILNFKPKDPDGANWKPVKPNPGYCVKLHTVEGDKVFVNVCHTDAIPEPVDMSEDKLLQMIMDDEIPGFRIPISIGDLHIESDKSRNPVSVYDIAVNSKFFKRMDTSEIFNSFFLNVSTQALQEKYSLSLDLKSEKPFSILKNRKVFGKLQIHRIQQRERKKAPGELIKEVDSKSLVEDPTNISPKKKLIEVISERDSPVKDVISPQVVKTSKCFKKNVNDSNLSDKSAVNSRVQFNETPANSGNISEPTTPLEENEKGIKESRTTKDYKALKAKRQISNFSVSSLRNVDESSKAQESMDSSSFAGRTDIEMERKEVLSNEPSNQCGGLFCLKQYPEEGTPEILLATIRLNVKSSKDFNLQLDYNRLNISLVGRERPFLDVYLPYNIEVDQIKAFFVTESQKLMIQMYVEKESGEELFQL